MHVGGQAIVPFVHRLLKVEGFLRCDARARDEALVNAVGK